MREAKQEWQSPAAPPLKAPDDNERRTQSASGRIIGPRSYVSSFCTHNEALHQPINRTFSLEAAKANREIQPTVEARRLHLVGSEPLFNFCGGDTLSTIKEHNIA